MARRSLARPRDPQAVALAVEALRSFASPPADPTEFDRFVGDHLARLGVAPAAAARLAGNVDRIPRATRRAALGAFADTAVVRRDGTLASLRAAAPPRLTGVIGRAARLRVLRDVVIGEVVLEPADPPVHTIRYRGLFCDEESSWDRFSNSDEIYAVTSAVVIGPDGSNTVRTEKHPVDRDSYGDVDSNESRIGPVAACWHGTADVVSLSATVLEHDEGDPDEYRDEIDTIVKVAVALAILAGGVNVPTAIAAGIQEILGDLVNWLVGSGDDPISTVTVVLPLADLEAHSRHTPVELQGKRITGFPPRIEGFGTGLYHHFLTEHRGGGATYVVGYDVTRDPPLPIDDGPIL